MLFRKMLRDMSNNKMQFVSIFIMAFLGVFIYIGIGAEWYGMEQEYTRYYNDTNMADIWIYGENMNEKDVRDIRKIRGINAVENRLTLNTIGDFGNKPEIKLSYLGNQDISKMFPVSGRDYDRTIDGIWIDDKFAKAKGLKVGDEITLKVMGLEIEKEIIGTVYHPEYVYQTASTDMFPNHYKCGFAFISEDFFPRSIALFHTELLIKTDRTDFDKLEDEISDVLDNDYSLFMTRDDFTSCTTIRDEAAQHKVMGNVFPIAFLAIAMLTILTTMTRLVTNQRTQIGSLKALGFSSKSILLHYISYGFWLSLAGSIAGAIVGPLTLPYLFYPSMSEYYNMLHWTPKFSPYFISMVFISVAICTASAYFSCSSVLKDTPAETLRPKTPPAPKGRFNKAKFWRRLSFNSQWNLRDVVRGKMRSLMGIVGVAGCTGLIVCAFGAMDSIENIGNWVYDDMNNYTTAMIVSDTATQNDIDSIMHRFTSGSDMQNAVEIRLDNKKKSGVITVTDTNGLITYLDVDKKPLEISSDGITMSSMMASDLGAKVGDTVSWQLFGEDEIYRSKISAIYRSPTVQGFVITKEAFENTAPELNYKATSIYTKECVKKLYKGISGVQDNEEQHTDFDEKMTSMVTMVYILILAAALLAVVVLYNLGILSYTEKERELATLKVIGFQGRKLRYLLFQQNMWLTIIGCVLGFPFGYWLIYVMCGNMEMDIAIVVNLSSKLLSIFLTFLFSITVNVVFSRRINKLDMVSSLKGVE